MPNNQIHIKAQKVFTQVSQPRTPYSSNYVGNRGEILAELELTRYDIFRIYRLGDKAPTNDFFLEFNESGISYHALIQVKSTIKENPYTNRNHRLKVKIKREDLERLKKDTLLTYLVGVDVNDEKVYFAPIADSVDDNYSSSMPTTHVLCRSNNQNNKTELEKLRNDILTNSQSLPNLKQNYQTTL